MERTVNRSLLYAAVFAVMCQAGQAQNLVPNPSFEEYSVCPDGYGQFLYVEDWFWPWIGNPDYYNECNTEGPVGVPTNFYGYQVPATGTAYCGMIGYSASDQPGLGLHEMIGIKLPAPLAIGQTYWASFKVSWTTGYPFPDAMAKYASNKLGVYLAMDSLVGESDWYPLPNTAQLYSDEIITDSVGWTIISGHFVADQPYPYLYIGNFFDDLSTGTVIMQPESDEVSYYYVDDVCLSEDPLYCPMAVGIREREPDDPPTVAWGERPGTLRFVGAEASIYRLSFFDLTGRLLEFHGFTSGGRREVITLSTGYDAPAPVILHLQGGGREWHYKLSPPVQ